MKTTRLSKLTIASIVATLGLAMVVNIAIATNHDKESKESKILEQVSNESNMAMRDLRWARVALFDGKTDSAKTYLDEAKKNLETAEKDAPQMIVTINTKNKIGDKTVSSKEVTETSDYVPIDAWLVLSEDFVATPEKNAKIKEANDHLKNNKKDEALEVLHSADIDVSVGRMLMPLGATLKHVDKAIDLMKEQKYYEANLALKDAEDGLIEDSVMIVAPTTDNGKNSATSNENQKG